MNLSHIFTALPLIMTLVSQAEIFTIHITNTYGNYVFSEVKRFHIDLGTDLESVQEARFMCSGIMSTEGCPGSFFAYLGENRQGKIPRLVVLEPYWNAMGTIVTNKTLTFFKSDVPFQPIWNVAPSWDFLLDGEVDGCVRLFICGGFFPEIQYPITGNIHNASIIIDATPIPEPGLLLLFLFSLFFSIRSFTAAVLTLPCTPSNSTVAE